MISVIIPFLNSTTTLSLCLQALDKQTVPRKDYEILVVDNGSTVSLRDVALRYPQVIWLNEERKGSYAARNKGIIHARGDILAFTDADCLPECDWLEQSAKALCDDRTTIIGGRVEFLPPIGGSLNAYELFEEQVFSLGNQRRNIEQQKYAATANLATYRSTFDRVGLFDPEFKSGGDKEWGQRAVRKGELLRYAERSLVRHPRRSTRRELQKKVRRIAGGKMVRLRKQSAPGNAMFWEIFGLSIFHPKVSLFALTQPRGMRLPMRLHFLFTVYLFSWIAMYEKIRVYLGGDAYRG